MLTPTVKQMEARNVELEIERDLEIDYQFSLCRTYDEIIRQEVLVFMLWLDKKAEGRTDWPALASYQKNLEKDGIKSARKTNSRCNTKRVTDDTLGV